MSRYKHSTATIEHQDRIIVAFPLAHASQYHLGVASIMTDERPVSNQPDNSELDFDSGLVMHTFDVIILDGAGCRDSR